MDTANPYNLDRPEDPIENITMPDSVLISIGELLNTAKRGNPKVMSKDIYWKDFKIPLTISLFFDVV